MQRSAWLVAWVAWVLCAWAGVLLFGNKNAGISGTNELADRFVTQLALETYRPGGIITSDSMEGWTGEYTGNIDLSLTKELVSTNSLVFKYKITVRNEGSETATNFTVKDYKPSTAQFAYTYGGIISNNTVTWKVASLWVWASKVLYVEIKRGKGMLINKAEVCDYEEAGEREDPDSNPCTMGPNGNPVQDDESMVTILTGSTGASHLACVNQACVYVAGNGANTCSNNSGCIIEITGNNNTGVVNNTGSAGSGFSGCFLDIDVWTSSTGIYLGSNDFTTGGWASVTILPNPLYAWFTYASACSVTNMATSYTEYFQYYPQYWYGRSNTLQVGTYSVVCSILSPTGQIFACTPGYFSIE